MRETGTDQQVAQLLDFYMMMMMIIIIKQGSLSKLGNKYTMVTKVGLGFPKVFMCSAVIVVEF
jgi:hypothetical protein